MVFKKTSLRTTVDVCLSVGRHKLVHGHSPTLFNGQHSNWLALFIIYSCPWAFVIVQSPVLKMTKVMPVVQLIHSKTSCFILQYMLGDMLCHYYEKSYRRIYSLVLILSYFSVKTVKNLFELLLLLFSRRANGAEQSGRCGHRHLRHGVCVVKGVQVPEEQRPLSEDRVQHDPGVL